MKHYIVWKNITLYNERTLHCIHEEFADLVKCYILKQLHCVRCPTLEPLGNGMCGSPAKTFGDPVLD